MYFRAGDKETRDCDVDLMQAQVPHLDHTLRHLKTGWEWVVAKDEVRRFQLPIDVNKNFYLKFLRQIRHVDKIQIWDGRMLIYKLTKNQKSC